MPYRAFVSSTFIDLKEHRAHVIRALRKAGFDVDPMEDWTAATDEPKTFSQARLAGCDLCVLIVALRRGHIPQNETFSITQLEHIRARESMDVLAFVLREGEPWQKDFDELEKDPELRRWRAELFETKGVGAFGRDPESMEIAPALTRWVDERTRRQAIRSIGGPREREWLAENLATLQGAFAAQMAGGGGTDFSEACASFVELLVKPAEVAGATTLERPFAVLAKEIPRWLVLGGGGTGKTVSLLNLALYQARLALDNGSSFVPLYSKLNSFDTTKNSFDRLFEVIASSTGIGPVELRRHWYEGRRPLLLFLDGFNEIASDFQAACVGAVQEMLRVRRHGLIITSRPESILAPLTSGEVRLQPMEIVELSDTGVKEFLKRCGAGALYQRLGEPLRQLGRTPLILWALIQSRLDSGNDQLPRNLGELYKSFIDEFIFAKREQGKVPPPTRYNYKLVKRPVLSELAFRMTSEGVTRYREDLDGLKAVGMKLRMIRDQYRDVYELRPHEFMPDSFAAKALIDEMVRNGVMRRETDHLEFMHESVQDYFAAVALMEQPVAVTVASVPEAEWVPGEHRPANARQTPLRGAIVMLAGLLTQGDELVNDLLDKDITLAAECFFGSAPTSQGTRELLIQRIKTLLGSGDVIEQFVGCKAANAARVVAGDLLDSVHRLALTNDNGVVIEALTTIHNSATPRIVPLLMEVICAQTLKSARLVAISSLTELTNGSVDVALAGGLVSTDDLLRQGGTPTLMADIAALYQSHTSVDQLLEQAFSESIDQTAPACVLLRLLYRQEATERLARVARSYNDTARQRAVLLLPIVAQDDAMPILLAAIDDAAEPLDGLTAGSAVASVVIQWRPRGEVFAYTAELKERFADRSRPLPTRLGAAFPLLFTPGDEFNEVLRAASNPSEDEEFRVWFCCYAVQGAQAPSYLFSITVEWLDRPPVIGDFLMERALYDLSPQVRNAAATALSNDPARLRRIYEVLRDPNESITTRAAAADALGAARYQGARPLLFELVTAADAPAPALREAAMLGLAPILDEPTAGRLYEIALGNSDRDTALSAAVVLVFAKGKDALDPWLDACLDKTRPAAERENALMALALALELRRVGLDKLLTVTLKVEDDYLRREAALTAYNKQPAETTAALDGKLRESSADPEMREAAAVALALIDSNDSIRRLEEASNETDDPLCAGCARYGLWFASDSREHGRPPDRTVRVLYRATNHTDTRSWAYALTAWNELVAILPNQQDVYQPRSWCFFQLGRFAEALDDARKCIEIAPDPATAHAYLGELLSDMGKPVDASAAFAEALRLKPDNSSYLFQFGWQAYLAGDFEASARAFCRGCELDVEGPSGCFNLGLAELNLGNSIAAVAAFEEGVRRMNRGSNDRAALIEDAVGDLNALASKRPELSGPVGEMIARIRQSR
jgi:tetratricopeptide (TPR) repeat protein